MVSIKVTERQCYVKLCKTFIDFHQFCIAGSKVVRQRGLSNHQGKKSLSFSNSTVPRIFGEANRVKIKLQEVEGKKKKNELIETCIKNHGLETLMEETRLLPLILGR